MATQRPIEIDSIRTALDAMRQGERLADNHPLAYCLMMRLSKHGTIPANHGPIDDTVIFARLVAIIVQQLNRHRALYGLLLADRRAGDEAVKRDITEDFRRGNTELKAWSYLYHRYVRVDLDLSVEDMESLTMEVVRTLQRRQAHAVHRLAEVLNRRELRLRLHHRQADQRSRLLFPIAPPLFGRDALIDAIQNRLTFDSLPRHVLLSGPPGIGKTALALSVAHRLIDTLPLDSVIWLNAAEIDLSELVAALAREYHLPPGEESTLSGYVRDNDLIVVDDAEGLLTDAHARSELLRLLGRARLILCSALTTQIPSAELVLPRIAIPELAPSDALDYMVALARDLQSRSDDDIEYFSKLYDEFGGNPGALRSALEAGLGYRTLTISGTLYRGTWERLSDQARFAWIVLAMSPHGSLPISALADLLEHVSTDPDQPVEELIAVSAADMLPDVIRLRQTARAFCEGVFKDGHYRDSVQTAARLLIARLSEQPEVAGCLRVLEVMRLANLPVPLQLDALYAFANVIQMGGAWVDWVRALDPLKAAVRLEDGLWIALRLGIARRWLAQWQAAAYNFAEVIAEAGSKGLFQMQADAMLELAAIHRHQRQYDLAAQLIQRAESYYRRTAANEGLASASSERVLLALASGNLKAAQAALDLVFFHEEHPTARCLSLSAQLNYRQEHWIRALENAELAQKLQSGDLPRQGRTAALIGQIQHQLGNARAAIDQLLGGMTLMEQTGDRYGYARAKMNLAAVYLAQGNLRTALSYLRDLPAEFERLGDVESLQATMTNLAMLNQVAKNWK